MMDDTQQFVKKVQDTQNKQAHNKRSNGQGSPSNQLSTKQHSTNK